MLGILSDLVVAGQDLMTGKATKQLLRQKIIHLAEVGLELVVVCWLHGIATHARVGVFNATEL